ncbi:hypothetical protein BU16DRAFT_393072 [Lophium mytilinum]|uniref:Uncharacterized protein n=1 Tax=Lophium mytilinum TaxID=390894 RepID=A0A6A6QX05_9PEZI|nr:hypothetical protein BU16DRAFT_393072 [Lophium mytilinum]
MRLQLALPAAAFLNVGLRRNERRTRLGLRYRRALIRHNPGAPFSRAVRQSMASARRSCKVKRLLFSIRQPCFVPHLRRAAVRSLPGPLSTTSRARPPTACCASQIESRPVIRFSRQNPALRLRGLICTHEKADITACLACNSPAIQPLGALYCPVPLISRPEFAPPLHCLLCERDSAHRAV